MQTADEFLSTGQRFQLGFLETEKPHPRTVHLSEQVQVNLAAAVETLGEIDLAALEKLKSSAEGLVELQAPLGRYLEARRRWPDAAMLMGIGNLTELTDADSAGVNVLLAGFCQELGVRSVLATEVINWGRSAVTEFDLARRLVFHAVTNKVLPKRVEPNLVLLRDPKLQAQGEDVLRELAERITDRNYRLFAERGELHVMNGSVYLRGTDPFVLFAEMLAADSKLDASHAFYLGYEFAKAVTALTLGKNYEQDRALRWGFLTIPETSHRNSGCGSE